MPKRPRPQKRKRSAKESVQNRDIDISTLEDADDYYEALGDSNFIVIFTKKDLSSRVMKASCNIKKYKPTFVKSTSKKPNPKLISVLCIDDEDAPVWRSITLESITQLSIMP